MKRLFVAFLVVAPVGMVGCGKISADSPDANGAGATLTLAAPSQSVVQGGTATVSFTVAQTGTASLTVHVEGLQAGVTAADVAGSATGTLTLTATASAVLGSANATVQLLDGTQMIDQKPLTVLVSGPPGSLDTTFGTSGRVVFPLPDPVVPATSGNGYSRALVIYPASAGADANKILIGAELETTGTASTSRKLAVVRLNADGTPDTSFGTGGAAYALINNSPDNVFSPVGIALDSQSRVVVVANEEATDSNCYLFVARLTATGAADTGFTTFRGGSPFGFCGDPEDVAILTGDQILTMSFWNNPGADDSQRPLLAQLNSNGTANATAFSSGYSVRLPNPDAPAITKPTWIPEHILVDGQGNYLISGAKCEGGYDGNYSACESTIGRVTPAGAWDTTFGTGGLGYSALTFGTTTGSTNLQGFDGMALDASGNIVTVGWDEGYTTATIARFTSTGMVDTTFASSGRASPVLVAGGTVQELDEVAIDGQGRILGIGYAVDGGSLIAVTRYSTSGQLDTTYGTSGVTTAPSAGLSPRGKLQSDDRLIVVGSYPRAGGGSDVAIWRFWP